MNLSEKIASTAHPRVSVISIFFNAEKYFGEAIESVLAQEFSDFELILVDDGSTDASMSIARDYASRDPRVRYVTHPDGRNHGMSAARNLGLREVRGEFVAFIDADDRWRAAKLREQVALLRSMADVDAVGGTVNYWASHDGGKDRLVPTAHVRNRPIRPGEATLRMYPLGQAHAPSMSDLLFRRDAVEAVGGFEEKFPGAYEDQAFLAKFYLHGTLFVTDAVWSDYRLHDSSCMAKVQRQGGYDAARRSFLKWFERHLENSRFADDPATRRALKRALRERRSLRSRLAESPLGNLYQAGKVRLSRLRPILVPGPAILMYHRVADERFDPWELAVSPANFAEQLGWIARNRTVLPLTEFAELHRQGRLPRDAITLSFDDGYACNVETAVPLLSKLGIPATIFIPAELIEEQREFWWDELERIVSAEKVEVLRLESHEVNLGECEEGDDRWDAGKPPTTPRQQAYRELWELLYAKPPSEIATSMEKLRDQAGLDGVPRESHRPMTVSEVRSVRSELIEFGSHALSHPSLPKLEAAEKRREITHSLDACEAVTGVRPKAFAFPYGDADPESEGLAEEAGFLCACKADGRFVTRKSSTFALPRMLVGNWTSAELARRLGRP